MATNTEASNGDYTYLSYKRNMEGTQANKTVSTKLSYVGVAVFGLGRIGTIHLSNLRKIPRANIIYCVEESSERVNFVQNNWMLTETTFLKPSEQSKVFQDPKVDAIIICTPTQFHEELILKGLDAGKYVFCEKPLAFTEEGIEKCLASAKKHSKPILCAFNRRFDPSFRSMKTRIDAGEIGQVKVIKTCSRDSPKPSMDYLKISGGIFHDCAVHDLDYICWLLGEFPESLTAYAHSYFEDIKSIGDYDTVGIVMKFPSGVIGMIDLCRYAVYGYDQRIEVLGADGMLMCGENRPISVRSHDEKGSRDVPIYFSFASRYQEAYHFEMEHFLNVVQGIEKCEIEAEYILNISKIASACDKVVNTGKAATFKW